MRRPTYSYEVIESSYGGVTPGECLIQRCNGSDDIRVWNILNMEKFQTIASFTGIRRDQICSQCFYKGSKLLPIGERSTRIHGHPGHCGPESDAPKYQPSWIPKESEQ